MHKDKPHRHTGILPHQGSASTSPYPTQRLAPAVDLVDIAREIAHASDMLGNRTNAKLQVIAQQIKSLQEEARSVLEQANFESQLNEAECNFKKHPGQVYHLYRRPNQRLYFSMLSPQEWGGIPPHEYVDSYRLGLDMSWHSLQESPLETSDSTGWLLRHLETDGTGT